MELLRQRADRQGVSLKPPRVVTVGDLPEYLYRPAATVAVELERVLAWGNARSLYRLTPSREDAANPDAKRGINYVIGDTIVDSLTPS